MKFSIKNLLALMGLSAAMGLSAQEQVVKAQFCKPTTFLFGCQQFTSSGVYEGIDVGGETKTLNLQIGSPVASTVNAVIKNGATFLYGCETFAEKGQYVVTLESVTGCDSVVTLNLNIIDDVPVCENTSATVNAKIKEGATFLYGCQTFTKKGQYMVTLQNIAGCDSVVTLNLDYVTEEPEPVCQTTYGAVTAEMAEGETFLYGCESFTEFGDHQVTLVNAAGCDSIVTLTLKKKSVEPEPVCQTTYGAVTAEMAEGETFLYGCESFTEFGDHQVTLVNASGCDSIVTLTLKKSVEPEPVCQTTYGAVTAEMAEGETFLYGCESFTEFGDHQVTLVNAAGCDSIVTLTLKKKSVEPVCETTYGAVTAEMEEGETFLYGCETFTEFGDHQVTLVNAAGCDSIVTLTLKNKSVEPECQTTYGDVYAKLDFEEPMLYGCEVFSYGDTGNYTEQVVLVNAAGCDSIVTLHINVSAGGHGEDCTTYSEVTAELKDGETFLYGCETFTELGDHTVTLQNVAGCDSIVTLHLVEPTEDCTTYGAVTATIKEGETFLYGCETFTDEGDYTVTLTNVAGCDSIVTLTIEFNVCTITIPNPVNQPVAQVGKLLDTTPMYDELKAHFDEWNLDADNQKVDDVIITVKNEDGDEINTADPLAREMEGETLTVVITLDTKGSCVVKNKSLNLTVAKIHEEIESVFGDVCAGTVVNSRNGQEITLTVDTAWNDTVKNLLFDDGIQFFDSLYQYTYTIAPVSTTDVTVYVCQGEAYHYDEDNNDYAAQDEAYVITLTNVASCDSIINLTVVERNTTLPVADILNDIHAICGGSFAFGKQEYTLEEMLAAVQADIDADANFTALEDGSLRLEVEQDGAWVNAKGVEFTEGDKFNLRFAATSVDCGEIYSDQVTVKVEKPSAEFIANYGTIPAGKFFDQWMLEIDLKTLFERFGVEPKAEEVIWYQVGVADPIGTGYYFTNDAQLPDGTKYYAQITLAETDELPCGAIVRTDTLTTEISEVAPRLMPNRVVKGEQMNLLNLDPDVDTQISVYDAQGRMIEQRFTTGESQIYLRAADQAGMYLVKVASKSQNAVLRYIVVK